MEYKGYSLPRIFRVNWFRKDEHGRFIWPGYGQNLRVLKWVFERIHGKVDAIEGLFGLMPRYEDICWTGLEFPKEKFLYLTEISKDGVLNEAHDLIPFFGTFGDRLPPELEDQRLALEERAKKAS
jgi:phosphoenolpyruvate carboxykinase (GTP)